MVILHNNQVCKNSFYLSSFAKLGYAIAESSNIATIKTILDIFIRNKISSLLFGVWKVPIIAFVFLKIALGHNDQKSSEMSF